MPLQKGSWLDGVIAGAGGGDRRGGGGRRYEAVRSAEEKEEEEEGALGGFSGGRKAIKTGEGNGGSTLSVSTVGGIEVGLAGTPAAAAAAAAARATVVLPSTPLPAASSLSLLSRMTPLQSVVEEEEEAGFDGDSSLLSDGEKGTDGVEAEGRYWGDSRRGTVPPPAAADMPRQPPSSFAPFETESGGPSGSRSISPPSGSRPPGSRSGSRFPPFGAAAAHAGRLLDVMVAAHSWLVWPLLVLMLCTALLLVLAKVRASHRGSDWGVLRSHGCCWCCWIRQDVPRARLCPARFAIKLPGIVYEEEWRSHRSDLRSKISDLIGQMSASSIMAHRSDARIAAPTCPPAASWLIGQMPALPPPPVCAGCRHGRLSAAAWLIGQMPPHCPPHLYVQAAHIAA